MFTCVPGRYIVSTVLLCIYLCWYPNLSEGADRVGGQLRGDKVCPLSGVTNCGTIRRKVPESDARSVGVVVAIGEYVNETVIHYVFEEKGDGDGGGRGGTWWLSVNT